MKWAHTRRDFSCFGAHCVHMPCSVGNVGAWNTPVRNRSIKPRWYLKTFCISGNDLCRILPDRRDSNKKGVGEWNQTRTNHANSYGVSKSNFRWQITAKRHHRCITIKISALRMVQFRSTIRLGNLSRSKKSKFRTTIPNINPCCLLVQVNFFLSGSSSSELLVEICLLDKDISVSFPDRLQMASSKPEDFRSTISVSAIFKLIRDR